MQSTKKCEGKRTSAENKVDFRLSRCSKLFERGLVLVTKGSSNSKAKHGDEYRYVK